MIVSSLEKLDNILKKIEQDQSNNGRVRAADVSMAREILSAVRAELWLSIPGIVYSNNSNGEYVLVERKNGNASH